MNKKPRQKYHETDKDGNLNVWYVDRIWELAENLPVMDVKIDDIVGLDEVNWFSLDGPLPTCKNVAIHCRRIIDADLSYPIILTENKRVFDGMHRIAKYLVEGKTKVKAKMFVNNPTPDEIVIS